MKNNILLAAILFAAITFTQPINAQDMNPKITTFLMFEGDAEEAIAFHLFKQTLKHRAVALVT